MTLASLGPSGVLPPLSTASNILLTFDLSYSQRHIRHRSAVYAMCVSGVVRDACVFFGDM